MPYPASAKQKTPATIPYEMVKLTGIEGRPWYGGIRHILHLPGGQRFIGCSYFGSFLVWDLETGEQVGEEWEDKEKGVKAIALSPDGKTLASGSEDDAVILWNIDTGKVIKKWAGHTKEVKSVCWSSDGGRVVSGSYDGIFRVWDVESGRTILGPIKAGKYIYTVCYSPDAKMIATGGDDLRIWDASTGKLLRTMEEFITNLAWTSDGKTLIAAGNNCIIKFDTTTFSKIVVLELEELLVNPILLSPNERILASTSYSNKAVQLWNLETNQPIEPALHHEGHVTCAAFSADGMSLFVSCLEKDDTPIYKWELSVIVKDASLLSNNVDATQRLRPAPKITGAPRRGVPSGFFDDTRHADLSTSRTQSHGQHDSRTLSRLPSFWPRRPFNRHGATERSTQSWSSPFSWTWNSVSGKVRRRDGSDVELREPPIVEVPCTAEKLSRLEKEANCQLFSTCPCPSQPATTSHCHSLDTSRRR